MAKTPDDTMRDLPSRTAALMASADAERAVASERAATLGRARLRAASRDRDLAVAEGRGQAAAVAKVAARSAMLAREAERARVPTVTAAPHQAIVHGRVVDAAGAGRRGLVVVVLDGRGREVARVEAAEVGYFQFVFPPDETPGKGKGARNASAAAKARAEADTKATTPETDGPAVAVKARLEVRDAKDAVLARIKPPVELVRGQVVYRELEVATE